MQTKRSFTFQFSARATAQVRQKHLHCMGKAYNAGKSPVLKVFKGGLRLLPAACVALRAGPALPRKRKILMISLQIGSGSQSKNSPVDCF